MTDLRAAAQACWCQQCRPVTVNDMRMVVCPDCGDKRCVHAADHTAPCAKTDIYAHNSWVRAALAEPAPQPVAWRWFHPEDGGLASYSDGPERPDLQRPLTPLYEAVRATPPPSTASAPSPKGEKQ